MRADCVNILFTEWFIGPLTRGVIVMLDRGILADALTGVVVTLEGIASDVSIVR